MKKYALVLDGMFITSTDMYGNSTIIHLFNTKHGAQSQIDSYYRGKNVKIVTVKVCQSLIQCSIDKINRTHYNKIISNKEFEMYGLTIKYTLPNRPDVAVAHSEERFEHATRHEVKSKAGNEFWCEDVGSVCVWDETGYVHLYLRKNPDGSTYREVNPFR